MEDWRELDVPTCCRMEKKHTGPSTLAVDTDAISIYFVFAIFSSCMSTQQLFLALSRVY